MSITTPQADLTAVNAKQQATWSSGDYSMVAARIVLVSERLVDACDVRAGWTVLDVAAGNGNATLAAARSGARAIGVDYVPALLEDGRARALAEGLDVEFRLGDAEELPIDDHSVDAVVSVFGTMFTPDHHRTANEIIRVAKPGATVGLASWTPDGFIGQLFRAITAHVPGPAGVASPLQWGTEQHIDELFGPTTATATSRTRTSVFRFPSAEAFVAYFRRWYGPTLKAFEALDEQGRQRLEADLVDLARRSDRNQDGGSIAIPSTYLETVLRLR